MSVQTVEPVGAISDRRVKFGDSVEWDCLSIPGSAARIFTGSNSVLILLSPEDFHPQPCVPFVLAKERSLRGEGAESDAHALRGCLGFGVQ